jgi:hypothetical protein
MGLLQEPLKALNQIDWYIQNRKKETFPGAFELAAGNLCRQTLEQILFILCFYSRMPSCKYVRQDNTLKTVGQLLKALDSSDSTTEKTYWKLARLRGRRIRKFASNPRTLRKWQRELNKPSHFSTAFRTVNEVMLSHFLTYAKKLFDDKDKLLLIAAANELYSKGKIKATLSSDHDNTPGISQKVIVTAANIQRNKTGTLCLKIPTKEYTVISATEVPRGPWPGKPLIVQHTVGMSFETQLVTKKGDPVDISNFEGIIRGFAKTKGEIRFLKIDLKN